MSGGGNPLSNIGGLLTGPIFAGLGATGVFDTSAPSVSKHYGKGLAALINAAPDLFNAESLYQPKYNVLANQGLGISLLGGEQGPGVAELSKTAVDPQTTALLDQITQQAGSELGMGGMMDPGMLRQITQAIRSRRQGMLGGTGSAGEFNEALGISAFGDQLRQNRQQHALRTVVTRLGAYGSGPQLTQTAMGNRGSPYLFEPGISDLFNTGYNANAGFKIGNTNRNAGLIGGGISAFGQGLGAVASVGGFGNALGSFF